MSLAPQQFCVRWNSYHTNLQTVFPKLLTTENFVDVTLACENRQIKCHKVVLSACSTYFERLLIQNPCKHPIIFMKDMRFSEMQSLVDFMYKGEVNVSQDDLPSLLKSAEALQIRGLCGSDSGGLGSGNSQTGCESDSPIHSSASHHSASTASKSSEHSKLPPTNDKPISPASKDTSNSNKSSLLQLSSNQHTDQSSGRSSTERQVAQTPRRTANSEQASTATSNESQLNNNTSVNTNGRNHQRTTSTTTRNVNNINGEAGSTNLLGSGSNGEGSGVFKEETVEEDGLFYGEMENDDMECGDQTEEDLLQTGSTGLPNSDKEKTSQLRVKSKSELCNKRSIKSLQYPLMNKMKKFNQTVEKSLSSTDFRDRFANVNTIQNNNFDLSNLVVKNPDCNIDINILNRPSKTLKINFDDKINDDSIINSIPMYSENNYVNNDNLDELAYEDEEYLKLWLAQNQELEVSLSTGSLVDCKTASKLKNKDASLKRYQKLSNDGEEKKWLQYYTGELPMPKKTNNINFVGVSSVNKKKNKHNTVDSNIIDPNVDLVDLLMPSDLEQFLAGKEVSSSGISRKAIEQAMMGKYNPNRRYSNQAMWAALMDVKQGGSIYRAAQTHKVPRKSLRNWMKRWHIKSSFPMPQQLKQFVENNKKHKLDLTREHILSYTAHNQLSMPDQTADNITIKGENDNNDPEAFKHFLEMSHEFFRSGLNVASSEDDDIVSIKKPSVTVTQSDVDLSKPSRDLDKNDKENAPEKFSKPDSVDEKEKDGDFSQIMDMSGNILFDDNVGAGGNHEDSHNEDDYMIKDANAPEPAVVAVALTKANVNKIPTLKKHVLFSNVEQLAGLDEIKNVSHDA